MDASTLTTPRRDGADAVFDLPDGWQQGRATYGGLVVAMLLRALDDAGPVRSVQATLAGPVQPGAVRVTPRDLRVGSGTSFREAHLVQGGETLASALVVTGRTRASDADFRVVRPPEAAPWGATPPLQMAPPIAPVFTQHFVYQFAGGQAPFSGAADAGPLVWVRPRARGTLDGAPLAAFLIDAVWPAIATRLQAPRPIATVAFTMQMIDGFGDPDAPTLLSVWSDIAHDGYLVEWRELWGQDGRLIARNQQTIALIK